jgi:hypothetical protein
MLVLLCKVTIAQYWPMVSQARVRPTQYSGRQVKDTAQIQT